MLWPLYPWAKCLLYPLDRRLGEHQSQSGYGWGKKNPFTPAGSQTLVVQPIT